MHILLAIHIPTREATIVGMTECFDDAFMARCARNLTLADVGFLSKHGAETIIMDRDSLYTLHFKNMPTEAGVTIQQVAPRCLWQNGYRERCIGTLRTPALRKASCLSETDLLTVLDAALLHYNRERPHRSPGNKPIMPVTALTDISKPIMRVDHLGGAIHHHARTA